MDDGHMTLERCMLRNNMSKEVEQAVEQPKDTETAVRKLKIAHLNDEFFSRCWFNSGHVASYLLAILSGHAV